MIVTRTDKAGKKYVYIRECVGKWELYHRHLWRQHFGEIPKGMNVVFKDGNSENCVIENLELIDKRENLKRNSVVNLPEEVRSAIAYVREFNHKINRHEQNNK